MGFEGERRRWRVRLRDDLGAVRGAGTMLDEHHLLTSAHVVESAGGPHAALTVEFVGLSETAPGSATVVEGCWVPPEGRERGDLALLRLAKPEPKIFRAPLHRMPLSEHQLVRAFGFPPGAEFGRWSHARLAGLRTAGGEWIQLQRTGEAEPLGPGYCGTAVLDETTGSVIGMVAGKDTGTWMIPVESMLGHLPRLGAWTTGSAAVDSSFGWAAEIVDVPFVREFGCWLGESEPGAVWVVVTGGAASPIAAALRLVVVLADRERSPGAEIPAGLDIVPVPGSIDLAVDATGRTADDVRRRISERLNLTADGAVPGRTLVVDGIDDAAEPDRLVDEVLATLAGRAADLGVRLVLGFRRESSPGVAAVRSSPGLSRPAPDDIAGRLRWLAEAIDEVAAIEEYQLTVATRFTGVVMLPARSRRLRSALNQLKSADVDGDAEWVERHIGGCERTVAPAVEDGRRQRAVLDDLLAKRDELRARLEADAALAKEYGLDTDPEVGRAYRPAQRLLFEGPCELPTAVTAVDTYATTLRTRLKGG